MAEGTQAATSESAAADSGISLADDIAELLGEGYASETAADVETPGAQAGATPATATATTEVAAEGADKEARAGDTPADATRTDPDKAGTETQTEPTDAMLADAKPLTYTVNGEERTFEGVKVLGDAGAIVTPEALELLTRRLGERDHLFETNREQYARVQDFEKLSEWHSKDAEGKDQVTGGTEGLLAARVQLATLAAAYETLATSIRDPQVLTSLLAQNEKGEIVLNEQGLKNLILQSENAEMKASTAARNHFMSMIKSRGESPQQREQGPASVDYAKEAPQLIDGAARAASVDPKLLNEADRKFLAEQIPHYVRQVTQEDRQWNPALKIGSPIVDARFTLVVKDRATMRADMTKTVKANSSAADENARRLAAAAAGTRTKTAAAATTTTPAATRESDADRAWRDRERAAAASLR